MNKRLILKIILIFSLLAIYFRFFDLKNSYMNFDSGYELEAARLINQNKELPLVGPAVGIKNVFIPPTYLYLMAGVYFISDNVFFITVLFALLGLLTIFIFSFLIYLLTNDKIVSLFAFIFFSLWTYHIVYISRQVWHPNPVFFFLSLSLLLGTLALKNKNLMNLIFSQFFFFIALSIYPSPIFVFPIIVNCSYYFFNKNANFNRIKSIIYTALSIFITCCIVYSPLLIFEIKNQFISFQSVVDLNVNMGFKPLEIINHFQSVFKSFYLTFFIDNDRYLLIFLILFVIISFSIIGKNSKRIFYKKPFTSSFLLIWSIFFIYLLKELSFPEAVHRFDVLALVFLIWLFLVLNENRQLESYKEKFIFYMIVVSLLLFSAINFISLSHLFDDTDVDSILNNQEVSQIILNSLNDKEILRQQVLVFSNLSKITRDNSNAKSNLWAQKWQGERIDHFINKKYPNTNYLVDNFQHTKNYYWDLDYLDFNYYYLVCNGEESDCISNFLFDLYFLSSEEISQHQFFVEDEILFKKDELEIIKVYLVKNFKTV